MIEHVEGDGKGKCPDCQVEPGKLHQNGCDVARCALCGGQAISCDCGPDLDWDESTVPWTGLWPGVAECREWGWYAYFIPYGGWHRCEKDHEGASEDLNRLYTDECVWNPETKRFDRRTS